MPDDRSEIRREQILQAAMTVFAHRGFNKARMDDIVKEAGLSKGAVYWYFKSKEQIILAILDRFLGRELSQLEEMLGEDRPARERIQEVVRALAQEVDDMLALMPLAYDFYALATRHNRVQQAFQDYFEQYRHRFESLVSSGIKRGEFKKVDVKESVVSLIAMFEGMTLLWTLEILDRSEFQLVELFESSLNLILDGLAPD